MVNNSETQLAINALSVEEIVSRLMRSEPGTSPEYFEELIRRFEPLLGMTWRRLVQRQKIFLGLEYEDFVHDVYVRLFEKLSYLRNVKAFPGYFRQIALSVAYSYLRRHRGDEYFVDSGLHEKVKRDAALMTSIDEQIVAGIYIRSYLEQLSPREKEIVTFEFFHGLSANEIGKSLGISPGAVRATKARAFSKLRGLILRDARLEDKSSKST